MDGIAPQRELAPVSPSFEVRKNRRHTVIILFTVFSIAILTSGLLAGLALIKEQQDKRGKAFTGYSVTGSANVADVLTYARPGDVPQRGDLISEDSIRGGFYTLAKQFGSISHLEYQRITDKTLLFEGKAFLFYDESINKIYIFSRIENMPAIAGKVNHLWLQSSFEDRYFLLATSQTVVEDNIPVTYTAYIGDGDLRTEGGGIVYSYDDASITDPKKPESILLSVKF